MVEYGLKSKTYPNAFVNLVKQTELNTTPPQCIVFRTHPLTHPFRFTYHRPVHVGEAAPACPGALWVGKGSSCADWLGRRSSRKVALSAASVGVGALAGGPQCRMSIVRNAHVPFRYFCNFHVNFKKVPCRMSN